jgi:predicted restriction endonuclease
MNEQIKLDNETYDLIDQIDNVPIVDSFVQKNKVGRGSGEARLYLGAQQNDKYNFKDFFGDFNSKAFFIKIDFDDYLDDAKFEYEQQEQGYQRNISADWQTYKDELKTLQDREYFTIYPALGTKDSVRYYIRSDDPVWEYFRKIMLPVISYVTILKIKDMKGQYFFLFRPTLNYFYNKNYHPAKIRQEEKKIEQDTHITTERKEQLVQARNGQGDYRKRLLEEKSECFITRVNDERLLIASHIKPWSISDETEKIDHYNGLALTPTYDRMFDQGFISFNDDGTIIISPYISPLNIKKLNLVPARKYEIPNIEHRKKYLVYHRTNIFKK